MKVGRNRLLVVRSEGGIQSGSEVHVSVVCSVATLQGDFDRAARRVNDLEKENADLKAKYENAAVQEAQKVQQLTGLSKQLKEAETHLKNATIENATLRNQLESREFFYRK